MKTSLKKSIKKPTNNGLIAIFKPTFKTEEKLVKKSILFN